MDKLGTTRVRHSTYSGYTNGCRCAGCTAANTEQQRTYRARNIERVRAIERRSKARIRERLLTQLEEDQADDATG